MRARDFDVAIIGGGCAGLSLAERLAGAKIDACVIEPRRVYAEDRTWCFWTSATAPRDDRERRRWSSWRVSDAAGRVATRTSRNLAYCALSSKRFYDRAIAACQASGNVVLFLGESVDRYAQESREPARWRLETSFGAISAARVVDTRPSDVRPAYAQYFVGFEIVTADPAFDPKVVDLMAFGPARSDRIEFDYVLPYAPDRALVEATVFAADPPSAGELDQLIERSLARHALGRDYSVERVESGAIAMSTRPVRSTTASPAISLGLRGGAARPSTGYAFQRIQSAAELLSSQLRRGEDAREMRHDSVATRLMDRMFLSVLRKHPAAGPEMFLDLFHRSPRDRLESFLSGSNALGDQLGVIGALPPAKFLTRLAT